MGNQSGKQKRDLLILFFVGFLMPPTTWLPGLIFYGITDPWEMLLIAINPFLIGYVAIVLALTIFYLRKQLRAIELYKSGAPDASLEEAQKSICRIPRFFITSIALYVPNGVSVVEYGMDFISWNEFFYSIYIAVPIVFLFAIPFLSRVTVVLEKWTSEIPLAASFSCIRLRSRLFMNMVVSTIGLIALLFLFVYVFIQTRHDAGLEPDILELTVRMMILSLIGTILIVMNFFNVSRQLVTPVQQTRNRLKDISEGEGDLTGKLPILSRDEIGELSEAFNAFTGRIRGVVSDTKDVVADVSATSNQMLASVRSLSDDTRTQAASTEEISATIEEMGAGMENVSENASSQSNSIQQLKERMDELSSMISQVSDTIYQTLDLAEDITSRASAGEESLTRMNGSMAAITETSDEMRRILDIISGISGRTNLLSLNAAIEAARAGESGRGFAVVADEISKLADQTVRSLKDISGLIDSSAKEIHTGLEIATETTTRIRDITTGVERIRQMMNLLSDGMTHQLASNEKVNEDASRVQEKSIHIRTATAEQLNATAEISRSIQSITEVIGAVAERAATFAENTELMANQAEELKGKLDYFKV